MVSVAKLPAHAGRKLLSLMCGQGKSLLCLVRKAEGRFISSVRARAWRASSGQVLRGVEMVGGFQLYQGDAGNSLFAAGNEDEQPDGSQPRKNEQHRTECRGKTGKRRHEEQYSEQDKVEDEKGRVSVFHKCLLIIIS